MTSFSTLAQIIGYRKDRLGARIIALSNLLALEDKFGASILYYWPDRFEAHDLSINDPDHPIFDDAFKQKYIHQIPTINQADFGNRLDLEAIIGNVGTIDFSKKLAAGEQFVCTIGARPALFTNELGPAGHQAFSRAFERIVFSEAIQKAVNEASFDQDGLPPLALHVRRGDVTDVEPWRHKNWVSKFAPDEFYEAILEQPGVTAILFSDTMEVAEKISRKWPNAKTVNSLIGNHDLSELQRDLVELLLMARCRAVVAPSLSAFSSVASLIQNTPLRKLPFGLSESERWSAYDGLLKRIFSEPESFHNEGDFAQSLGYAFRHSLSTKKHAEFYSLLKAEMDSGKDFAFYFPLIIALAIACKDDRSARQFTAEALQNKNIWPDDLRVCQGLDSLAEHAFQDRLTGKRKFLSHYLNRHKTNHDLDSIAHYFFAHEADIRDLFMIDMPSLKTFSYGDKASRVFLFPIDRELFNGELNLAFPFWIPNGDWPELNEKPQTRKNISLEPTLMQKFFEVPNDLRTAEINAHKNGTPLPESPEETAILSTMATAFTLTGRYRRAQRLLFHCRKHRPDDPLVLKRLANTLLAVGENNRADANIERALEMAPDHVGLAIAMSERQQNKGDHKAVEAMLGRLETRELLPFTYFKIREKSLRQLGAKKEATALIELALQHYPDHTVFQKQWKNKLNS
jgi:tetratricopeptide (TPR) repeat protein